MALTLTNNNFEVNIHPVALFNIVHAYERRSEKFDTILGTLLGTRTANSIEVVDSFVVPHSTHSDVNKIYQKKKKKNLKFVLIT
jgi:predicted transcriptional regulator